MQTGEIAYFLVWLTLAVFMSGYGVGARALRRQRLAGPRRQAAAVDPVCGRAVGMPSAHFCVHHGHAYHFCSSDCRRAFEARPAAFLARETHSHAYRAT